MTTLFIRLNGESHEDIRSMDPIGQKARAAAANIRAAAGSPDPEVGLLTGTGLGDSAASIAVRAEMDYADIPHFPTATVTSHRGRLLIGELHGRCLAAMQGRFHLYEGHSPAEVTFPIRVLQELGVRVLILTNASGGLNPSFHPGDIMIVSDHINLTGANPLVGPNPDRWGVRFPDMSAAYDPELAGLAAAAAERHRVPVQSGIYAGLMGPSLETPAEIRFLRTIGADAVGFSTVPEVIAAVHGGMRVLALSTITNVHDPDAPVPATVDEILEVAGAAVPGLEAIIRGVVSGIDGTTDAAPVQP